MKERDYNNSKDYINRWVISYADLVTFLLALFLVMYAVNTANLKNTPPNKINTEVKEITTVKMPKLQNELMKEFKNDENVLLLKDSRGLIIRLKDDILFGSADSTIQTNSYPTLDKIIDILSKTDNPAIIEGHTDSFQIKSEKY